jgi:hypothetical protein
MSHTPPVPVGNQSTYPIKERPHPHAAPARREPTREARGFPLLAAAGALGLVAAAVALFLRSGPGGETDEGQSGKRSHG